ncbi:ExeM/NucH family extracellular endonuclease [Frigoribacterium sp. CFBP 13729]|uniref:ExeM/NucH family extracellular endonuclease n=1 Tax=Frigoribacterium sp. CFBP 13729 TaxID=2775293 RepID=UPI00177F02CE|nr:ExeM/NucH family extracellular endonuclease [Frigoribacterium sp. CFBP 13729]MBD8610911.1 ExeM/NucH family extracellular endonuclease [Frigoribacterium sp. CFBP 13729]
MSPRPRHTTPRAVALVAGLAVLLGPLVPAAAASAAPGDAGVVIAEVYAKGGSANAPYTNKFAELYNPTTASVALAGWSLQYRSATGTGAFTAADLSGAIAPGGHYLVQMSSNGSTGAALPTPDAVTTLNPAGASGVLVLSNAATPLTLPAGSVSSTTPGVVDALGWGLASVFETSAAELGSGNGTPTSYVRTDFADTDVNSADFTQQSQVTPQNSGGGGTTPTDPVPVPDPVSEADVTIAELQGTTDVSPWAGRTVTTRGVVTATYPTGGLNGYVIQTPGTGGALDLGTHLASDAVFVYSASTVGSVELGDHVEVVGGVTEFNGLTQVVVTGATSLTVLDEPAVAPLPATLGFPATDAQRESLESMLVLPQGGFTVTDTYTTNQYGEVKLAVGDRPLIQPTEVALPGSAEAAAVAADNAARAVTLDDGQSTAFFTNQSAPVSYLSNEDPVTVGAAVAFTKPVVLEYRNGVWKYQPTTTVTGETPYADLPVTFEDIRTDAPLEVGGDVKLASFNVLNYFTTTGDSIPGCTFYRDRAGAPLTVNSGCDARGAANAESLARQQVKIVTAINALGADVVSLEEIENSARFGKDRDEALRILVAALNDAAGGAVWDYPRSPAVQPANPDVIRLAFIYKKAVVEPVGESTILVGSAAFSNARQPLSQAFRPVGGDAGSTFVAIANHFKSKSGGTGPDADAGDGQGGSNGSRINQANALVAFAAEREAAAGTDKVFLLGDFNAYSMEDPIEVLRAAGYVDLGSTETDEYSYVFSGLSGSLDHVLASPAAAEVVTGVDIWNINSGEGIGLEYSRFNNNVRPLWQPDQFRSSDHDPVVVGVDLLADVIEPTDPTQPIDPDAPAQPGPPADPAAPAAPGGTVPAGQGSTTADGLAFTGSDSVAAWVALALGLLTAGGTLLVRRRRTSSGA